MYKPHALRLFGVLVELVENNVVAKVPIQMHQPPCSKLAWERLEH